MNKVSIFFVYMAILMLASACTEVGESNSLSSNSTISEVWSPDLGNGNYKNPIIFADYSDPDVVRVGADYYMTSSSFNCAPGLPILHSKDLVNWTIINYALPIQKPLSVFDKPQHGNGVWAPAIRFHNGEFYIFYGDPDFGIYMIKAKDAGGKWSEPHLVKEGKGWIDPCPLWDEDGKAYLVHAFAGSRSGLKSIIVVHEMSPDGKELLDNGVLVFDGHISHRTVEGSKFYKRDGFYYIFAPAGGVPTGWQLVMRSKDVWGPYTEKIVLHQGKTDINGPHQGAWVNTEAGEDWFFHFQDREAYGRIVHLQPMEWNDGWPIIGIDSDGDGIGEPVLEYKKPVVGKAYSVSTPQSSDDFNEPVLGKQWQWHANPIPNFGFPSGRLGFFRLNAIPKPNNFINFWQLPNLLMQKFTAEEFTATTKVEFHPGLSGDQTGLIIMGQDYSYLSLKLIDSSIFIQQIVCENARLGGKERVVSSVKAAGNTFYLQAKITGNAQYRFSFSIDNINYEPIGELATAAPGRWIGAKIGLFCTSEQVTNNSGYANYDWFKVSK